MKERDARRLRQVVIELNRGKDRQFLTVNGSVEVVDYGGGSRPLRQGDVLGHDTCRSGGNP